MDEKRIDTIGVAIVYTLLISVVVIVLGTIFGLWIKLFWVGWVFAN